MLAASVVEDEYLKKTGLTPMDIEGTQTLRAKYRTPEAQGHAERIMDIVNSINRVRTQVLNGMGDMVYSYSHCIYRAPDIHY